MFEALRKLIVPIIIIVLLFFTAMIVMEWGLGFSSRQSFRDTNLAAVINGEEITWQAYNRIFDNLIQAEIQQSPEGEVADSRRRQLHETAWQQLVHDRILLQEVNKLDFTVTDEEIYNFLRYSPPQELQTIPSFQTEGKFDYQKYVSAMADPQAASFWASLEPFVRSELMKLKLQEIVIQTAQVSEAEVKNAYLDANEQIKVGMVNVSFDRFSKPPPESTDDEMMAYFEDNRDKYYLDERRGLNIALLEKEPRPYDWEISFNIASQIYDSIKAGSDFAEMAKRYSTDGSAEDGGDLGWFPEGQMVPEFDKMVFSMRSDDLSEPIRTQFGWHIIKLHERKEEMETPPGKSDPEKVKKAHASHILIMPEVSRETLDELHNRLEEFKQVSDKSGFVKAAEDIKLPVRKVTPFFRGKNIQFIGNNPLANDFAFENDLNAISDLMENNSAYFLVQVSEILPAGPAAFEESKDKVHLDLLRHKVLTMCRDAANSIWQEIQAGTPIEKAAAMNDDEYNELEPFSRTGWVAELRRDPKVIGAAFSLLEPGEMTAPVEFNQGVAIFKLIERITPDLSEYNSKRDSVYSAVLTTKQQNLYSAWFDNLVKNAEIVNNVQKALLENPDFL